MFKLIKPTPIRFLAILTLGAVLLTGCARSTPETKPPEAPQIGVINMDKAIQAHPKYQEWQKLKQQAATLRQQLAVQAGNIEDSGQKIPEMNLAGAVADGLKSAADQEFNAKMMAKQQELQGKIAQKANQVRAELETELRAYAAELDKEYQPQIFNLQLKLQTVRMDEKQAAEVNKKLDDLKAEQRGKLAVREKALVQRMDTALAPEQAAVEQELNAYAKQLNAEISNKISEQTANMAGKAAESTKLPSAIAAEGIELDQQLSRKQQEINVLEEYILNDIRDKTAKVASERRLDAVLANAKVNASAVDITDAVIAAVKK